MSCWQLEPEGQLVDAQSSAQYAGLPFASPSQHPAETPSPQSASVVQGAHSTLPPPPPVPPVPPPHAVPQAVEMHPELPSQFSAGASPAGYCVEQPLSQVASEHWTAQLSHDTQSALAIHVWHWFVQLASMHAPHVGSVYADAEQPVDEDPPLPPPKPPEDPPP